MKLLKVFFVMFSMLTLLANAYSYENFEFLFFNLDENSNTNKVSYVIRNQGDINGADNFNLKIYHNDVLIDECNSLLEFGESTYLSKLTCDVPKAGVGEYRFVAKVFDDGGEEIGRIENLRIIEGKSMKTDSGSMSFEVYKNTTWVSIEVNESGKNLTLMHHIPKEVIRELTDENKDSLISSELDYVIIEADPLIAWNVENPPATINYTINKKVSSEDMKNFKMEIENDSHFLIVKYLVIFLIILIILMALKPMLSKKN